MAREPRAAAADAQLLGEVVKAIRQRAEIPSGVLVMVHDGVVWLAGTVAWEYQKDAAERAARTVAGTRDVRNGIDTIAAVAPYEVHARIAQALGHGSRPACYQIDVHAEGRAVVLTGNVRSLVEKGEAERAAWRTPGVWEVRNEIEVVS